MKKIISLLIILSISSYLIAQADYKAANEGWLVSLEEAYKLHEKTGKPILANFTGSDWCGWCIRLTKDVFSTNEFKTWSKDNVILLELDFPKRKSLPDEIKAQNASLQNSFKITGYPTIWVFNLNKKTTGEFDIDALGKTGYTKTPEDFIDSVEKMIVQKKTKKG
jgi:protein disulfide-isomerase